jgi:predicted regulator of Ras-like GTPase activity (Roadblock/LC7/MglB family)
MNKPSQTTTDPLADVTLEEILREMSARGNFEAAVLTSLDGLPIATVPADYESEVAAAMVAMLQQVSHDARTQLAMGRIDEVTIRDEDFTRLVCRYIEAEGQRLILAVVVPGGQPYRRVTNRALRDIAGAVVL